MKLRDRVARWLANIGPVKAQYEAARWSTDRSYIPGSNTDAKYDVSAWPRMEIMRKARYFEKNHTVPNKLLDLLETNVVGTGINPTPGSLLPDFNKEALAKWNQWANVADITSRQHFYALQSVIVRAQAVDGEIFVWLTKGETGNPRLQLIESHRCVQHAAPELMQAGWTQIDGIIVDARGRPQFYLFSDDLSPGGTPSKVTAVPADEVVHFYEPSRTGQYRGLSIFHPILATLHDLDDLQRYEMLAAKDASSRANIIETESGELPDSIASRFAPSQQSAPAGDTVISENNRRTYYENAFGAKTISLRKGETFKQSENNRPNPAMREFWEYLTANCCRGIGISFAAYQDYAGNWGGAALRGAVTSDNRFYEIRTQALSTGLDRIWRHVIGTAIQRNEFTAKIPADWTAVKWQPPRRASVDIGYDSAATINDLRAGIRTMGDIIGEAGGDAVTTLTKRADELKLCMDLEKSRKLLPGSLSCLFPNPPQVVPDASSPAPGEKKP